MSNFKVISPNKLNTVVGGFTDGLMAAMDGARASSLMRDFPAGFWRKFFFGSSQK